MNKKHKRPHSRNTSRQIRLRALKRIYFCTILGVALIPFAIVFFRLNPSPMNHPPTNTEIPESLLAFKEHYPEASEFVENYPNQKHTQKKIDISNELHPGTIPSFIQWDKRWGYQEYGDDLLALTGCGPTSISMVISGLTESPQWTPLEVANFSEQQGYFVPGEGTSWSLMTEGAQLLGLQATLGDISTEYIKENLTPDSPMICSVYPGDFTYTGHFIVLTGLDSNGNILVNDPNSKINTEKTWSLEVLLPQIRSLWKYHL